MQCLKTNPLIADAVAMMLDEGTKRRSKRVLREELDRIGASIEFASGSYRTHFSAQAPVAEAKRMVGLLVDMLKEPIFPTPDFAVLKHRLIGESAQARENTGLLAWRRMLKRLYPREHPNYDEEPDEEMKFIKALERGDLVRFHSRLYGLGDMRVAIAGDLSQHGIGSYFQDALGTWKKIKIDENTLSTNAIVQGRQQEEFILVSDKANIDLIIGIPIGISEKHEDFYPLFVGVHAFGSAFFSRLMQEVRVKQGLTYGVYAQLGGMGDGADGYFSVRGTFAPAFYEKGKKAVIDEINRFIARGINAAELTRHKSAIAGNFSVGLGEAGFFP
jgi:zinc protease